MRRIVVAVCCKAKDLVRRLATAPRVLEPEELPSDAELAATQDQLSLLLWRYHEARRLELGGAMENQETTALAVPDRMGMQMITTPAEATRRLEQLQSFIRSVMKEGEDYGQIPGTGNKPTLFQPGAQKLAEIYGLGWRYECLEAIQDWEQGFFFYRYRCLVCARSDGNPICEGLGSCNNREDKYAWRWVFESDIPTGIDKKTLATKTKQSKKTGNDYRLYRVPNEDAFSLVDTIEKMAAKRSLVSGVIAATRSSGIFARETEEGPNEAAAAEPQMDAAAKKLVGEIITAYSEARTEEAVLTVSARVGEHQGRFDRAHLAILRLIHKGTLARVGKPDEPESGASDDWVSGTRG